MTVNRRDALKIVAVAGAVATASRAGVALQAPYPQKKIARLADLKVGQPVLFGYPDDSSPAYLVKLGKPGIGGVGKDGDIVAFSALCTHMGFVVQYTDDRFICPRHYSQFDPTKNGQCFQGVASAYLPQVRLTLDEKTGDIVAEGVDGLVWGRVENRL